jgi:hypothetical protein
MSQEDDSQAYRAAMTIHKLTVSSRQLVRHKGSARWWQISR